MTDYFIRVSLGEKEHINGMAWVEDEWGHRREIDLTSVEEAPPEEVEEFEEEEIISSDPIPDLENRLYQIIIKEDGPSYETWTSFNLNKLFGRGAITVRNKAGFCRDIRYRSKKIKPPRGMRK